MERRNGRLERMEERGYTAEWIRDIGESGEERGDMIN